MRKRIIAGVAALLMSSAATAEPSLDNIRSWTAPDDATLIVDTYDMRTYRISVDEACGGLQSAERIGFSSELADSSHAPTALIFDNGLECPVRSVARVEWKPRRDGPPAPLLSATEEAPPTPQAPAS